MTLAAEELGLTACLLAEADDPPRAVLLAVGHPRAAGAATADQAGAAPADLRLPDRTDPPVEGPAEEGVADNSGVLLSFLEIASASAAAEDLDRLLAAIAAELARLFPVDRADIGLVDDSSITAVTVTGRSAENRGRIAGRFACDESHHLGYVTSRNEPLWRNDVANELRFRETLPRAGAQSDMTIPLRSRGRVIGALRVASGRRHAYEAEEFDLFQRLADLLAVAVENQRLLETTRRMAEVDGLTGACNHRHFSVLLAKEAARAVTTGLPVALVMVDIDHFKRVNDTHGHPAGDAALRHIVGLLVRRVRRSDVVARYGGEEFAVLLPGSDAPAAARLAEGLRADIAGSPLQLEGAGPALSLSASFGVAAIPANAADGRGLLEAADRALYRAKESGRDRVVEAPPAAAAASPGAVGRR
jgi:diguanylate cyclase (GGDEF)-like protein